MNGRQTALKKLILSYVRFGVQMFIYASFLVGMSERQTFRDHGAVFGLNTVLHDLARPILFLLCLQTLGLIVFSVHIFFGISDETVTLKLSQDGPQKNSQSDAFVAVTSK